MITKDFTIGLKEINLKDRIVEGYFASFDTLDSDNDIIRKGAFSKSLKENGVEGTGRIKHLFNHWETVGVLEKLFEDDFGLRFRSKVGNHARGNDVLFMYEDGIITEHSIGFEIIPDKTKKGNERELMEVKLWEGSSLDKWGANQNTPVIKSKEQYDQWVKAWTGRFNVLTKALRSRTNYTDEQYQDFIIQLEVLKSVFTTALESLEPKVTQEEEPQKKLDYKKIINLINV